MAKPNKYALASSKQKDQMHREYAEAVKAGKTEFTSSITGQKLSVVENQDKPSYIPNERVENPYLKDTKKGIKSIGDSTTNASRDIVNKITNTKLPNYVELPKEKEENGILSAAKDVINGKYDKQFYEAGKFVKDAVVKGGKYAIKALKDNAPSDVSTSEANIPLKMGANVRSFVNDISGINKDITEKDFSKDELEALREAVKNAKADGRSNIKYDDYKTSAKNQDIFGTEKGAAFAKKMLNDPKYSMKTTLGRANIEIDDKTGDTTVVDKYNHDGKDATSREFKNKVPASVRGVMAAEEIIMDRITGKKKDASLTYAIPAKIGKYFGSNGDEGEGADVKINLTKSLPKLGMGGQIGSLAGTAIGMIPGAQPFMPLLAGAGNIAGNYIEQQFTQPQQQTVQNGAVPMANNYGGVPTFGNGGQMPNALVENNEYIQRDNGQLQIAKGETHEGPNGGIPVKLRGEDFVFPANMKKEVDEAKGDKFRLESMKQKVLADKKEQERKYAIPMLRKGGTLPMYAEGGGWNPLQPFVDNQNELQQRVNNPSASGMLPTNNTPATSVQENNPLLSKENAGYGARLLGEAVPTIWNAYQYAKGAEVDNVHNASLAPANDIKNLKYNVQPVLDANTRQFNSANSYIQNNSASRGTAMANVANVNAIKMGKDQEARVYGQNKENEYRIAGDTLEDSANRFNVGQQVYTEDINARNRAAANNYGAAAASGISNIVSDKYKEGKENQIDAATLETIRTMYPALRNAGNAELINIWTNLNKGRR